LRPHDLALRKIMSADTHHFAREVTVDGYRARVFRASNN